MPFISGGFSKFRDKQQANSMNKSEEESYCGATASELEENDQVAGLTGLQTESMKDEALKTNFQNDSHNQNEKYEFQLKQTKESLMCLNPETFPSCQDTFTWKIKNFLKLPMNEDYFIDSREFSFSNTMWCLRMYPNGKKGNHEGWVHLLLVQLQSSNSRHQIFYKLRLKVQDKDLYDSLTHVITLHGDMAEVGIITPLKRSDVSYSLSSCAQKSFLVAICEIKVVELSKSYKACEASSSHETEELSKYNQKLCLPHTIPCEDVFVWEIKQFFELPMNENYFIDSEKFSVANAEWCLRMYPNGQKDVNHGWIHLLLIRLNPSSSQQCIQYRLGLKMRRRQEYGTLTHLVTFHANAEEAGVLNLIKRSDIISMKKRFARNGILRVFCQIKSPSVDVTNKAAQLDLPSETSLIKKLENSSVGVLEKISFVDAKDVIWKIPSFVIQPMQIGHWMDSPAFSFLDENWCLRFYMKEKKLGKDWKIYMYLVRFNTCSLMYLIIYDLSILDRSGNWSKFKKHNCQGIYESHVMKLGESKLHFPPDGFVEVYFQILSKEGLAEASNLTDKPRYLEFPLNDVELYGPSLFQHGMLFQKSFLAATEIMWKIPDFVELRKSVVDSINSPVFEFGSDTWMLQLYPNGFENTPLGISFVISRLFTTVMKQHIICHFSIRDSTNIISRCKLEDVFEGSSKSHPVHLELPEIMNKPNAIVPDGILIIFCQIYIVNESESTGHLEPITKSPSNAMNQFRYGLLSQLSFSAVTDITWEIPNFLALENDCYYINSPVFNLSDETWLLQLYPNGYETSEEKISLAVVRLFPSDINHHIICRYNAKSTNNVVDGKGSCENTFKNKILKSSPTHLKKFKRKQEEEDPNDLLTVFCQMYIVEDKKSILETSSESAQSKEKETFSPDDMKKFMHGTLVQQLFLAATEVIWKIPDFFRLINKKDNFINSPIFGLANDTWLLRLYLKGNEKNMKKSYCVLIRSFSSSLERHVIWKISIKNEKNMVIESGTCESTYRNQILRSCPIHLDPSKIMNNMRENLPQDVLMLFCQMYIIDDNRETVIKSSSQINQPKSVTNEDPCVGDIVIVKEKEKENKSHFSEGFQDSQDLISKEGNRTDINKDFSRLDLPLLKKKKKKNTVVNQLDAEHHIQDKKIEENLVKNEDLCIVDRVVLKENKNKSNFSEGFQNNIQDSVSKDGRNILEGGNDNIYWDELDDFNHLKKKNTIMNQLEEEHLLPEEKYEGNMARNDDQCIGDMVILKDNENQSHFPEGFQSNSQNLVSKDGGTHLEDEKDDIYWDELDFTRLKKKRRKKKNAIMNQLEVEHPLSEQKNEASNTRNEDLCTVDMVDLKENENKSYFSEEFQNSQDSVSKDGGNVLEDGNDNLYWDELDFTHLKKKKKKKAIMNQLEAEHSLPEEKNEACIAGNENLCIEDMHVLKKSENKSHFSGGFQNKRQKKKIPLSDIIKKKKKKKNDAMNQFETEHPLPGEKNEASIARNEDQCIAGMVVPKENENKCHFSKGFHNTTQDTIVKDDGYASVNAFKVLDADLNTLTEVEKINNSQLDVRYPDKEINGAVELEKDAVAKIHQVSENVSLCEKDYVKFLVRGEEIQAHLSAFKEQSNMFASVIKLDIMNVSNTVIIEDSDPQIFKTFLQYLNTGQVDVLTSKNMFGLYSIARKYAIHKLKVECLEYMKNTISVDTVCDIMAFSYQQKENEILELTTSFFFKNATEITSTPKWQTFLKENYMLASELVEKGLEI